MSLAVLLAYHKAQLIQMKDKQKYNSPKLVCFISLSGLPDVNPLLTDQLF